MSQHPTGAEDYRDPLQVYAEADAETRSLIEKELERIDHQDARTLQYGVLITVAFLAACIYLIATEHGVEGTVLGVIFIAALVAVLAVSRRR